MLQIAFLIVSAAYVGWITIAVFCHFTATGAKPTGVYVLGLLTFANYGTGAIYVHKSQSPWMLMTGLLLCLLTFLLFEKTRRYTKGKRYGLAFDDARPTNFFSGGPFRIVRHPFYTSYIVFWAALAIASQGLPVVAMSFALTALYVIVARREEKRFLDSSFTTEYAAYQKRTGMFVPRVRSWMGS